MKRIVVCVVTYNQEDYISRAIDSILKQKDWGLYRIVVSDDCSKDRTWDILKSYQEKYPDLFDLHRNEHNLGMYQNFDKVDTYLSDYDLYYLLAGDDELCDGFFESIQKLVEKEQIDTTEAVGIFTDWKLISPDGVEMIFKQDKVLSGYSVWELKLRNLISIRSSVMSKKVRDLATPTIYDKGLRVAESVYDAQSPLNIKKVYYINQTTSVYYAGIGESVHLSLKKSDYHTTQNIAKWNYLVDHYITGERNLHYAKYEIAKSEFYIKPTWGKLIQVFNHYERGQLPKCRPTLKNTVGTFWRLIKYKFEFNKD